MRRWVLGLAVALLVAAAPAAAFAPTDPLAAKQWYLADDHAFDAWAEPPTTLEPVKVAVVDSGVDCSLADFAGRIADKRSFVGGDPCVDTDGHGTFVAGVIAANLDGQGIVGVAYGSQLLVAKVVKPDGTIPLAAEAAAIRWAADSGARVINLSLGGVRDPVHRNRDTYSQLEANAVAYAYAKGAVLVAAVGNGDEAFSEPWPYASYPAALPHVIGVSALTRSGNVPDYSNRDAVYNDISAPGSGIFSTFPLALTAQRPLCTDQGYSDCGTDDYRNPEGTSFAAPQVSAAAAQLFSVSPTLTNSQVTTILEHSADDVNATNGCSHCTPLRDAYSGWGRLDVAKAIANLAGPLPAPDRVRDERRCRHPGLHRLGQAREGDRVTRLLRRSRRRLPRCTRSTRAPECEAERRLERRTGESRPLAPEHEACRRHDDAGDRPPRGPVGASGRDAARGVQGASPRVVLRRSEGRLTGLRAVHAGSRQDGRLGRNSRIRVRHCGAGRSSTGSRAAPRRARRGAPEQDCRPRASAAARLS